MKTAILTVIFSLTFSLVNASDIRVQNSKNAKFDCILSADKDTYKIGETPEFKVSIVNKTTKEVVFLGSLDGSMRSLRYPKIEFSVKDSSGKELEPQKLKGCGNINPLRESDFVSVSAGEAFDPFGKGFFGYPVSQCFPMTKEGVYHFTFTYSTDSKDIKSYGSGLGMMTKARPTSKELSKLFNASEKLVLQSNSLELKIVK